MMEKDVHYENRGPFYTNKKTRIHVSVYDIHTTRKQLSNGLSSDIESNNNFVNRKRKEYNIVMVRNPKLSF